MTKSSDTRPGVIQSMKSAWVGLIEGLHDRADLLSIELEQLKRRLFVDLILVLAVSFCAFMAVIAVNAALFVVFWEERVVLALILCGVYIVTTVGLAILVRWRIRSEPRPLDSTIDELRKDRSMLAGQ